MKKQIIGMILTTTLLMPVAQVSGTVNTSSDYTIQHTEESEVTSIKLAEDVFIEGLHDNIVLYVGEAIKVRGRVDEQATQKEISWQITGNNGLVDFEANGNDATITGKTPGTVWVMARATDGSDRAREFAINVKEQAKENQGTQDMIISGGSGTSISNPIIVTLGDHLTSTEKVALMRRYLEELKGRGRLSFMRKRDEAKFTSYILELEEAGNDFFIEIKVDKEDQEAYIPIIEMLNDLEKEALQGTLLDQETLQKEPAKEAFLDQETLQEEPAKETFLQQETKQEEPAKEVFLEQETLQEESAKEVVLEQGNTQEESLRGTALEEASSQEEPRKETFIKEGIKHESSGTEENKYIDRASKRDSRKYRLVIFFALAIALLINYLVKNK